MDFVFQSQCKHDLESFAKADRHTLVISGYQGCGKTYLGYYYATLVKAEDCVVVNPVVSVLRDTLNSLQNADSKIVLIVENLDEGVFGSSSTLLKFLEEPPSYVYIVVTCRNLNKVPDTILSRSCLTTLSYPINSDIVKYAQNKDRAKFERCSRSSIWRVTRSFSDVDRIFELSEEQLAYFDSLDVRKLSKGSVSTISWSLSHYPNGSECPVDLVVKYILCATSSDYIKRCCIDCLDDISLCRIAVSSIITKLAFELKYGG